MPIQFITPFDEEMEYVTPDLKILSYIFKKDKNKYILDIVEEYTEYYNGEFKIEDESVDSVGELIECMDKCDKKISKNIIDKIKKYENTHLLYWIHLFVKKGMYLGELDRQFIFELSERFSSFFIGDLDANYCKIILEINDKNLSKK